MPYMFLNVEYCACLYEICLNKIDKACN